MPGINTTGAPNTRDYAVGRGLIRFALNNSTTGLPDLDGFRDLGNAPEFTISQTTEDLKHANSRDCLKFTDKRFVISQEVGIGFQLDETRNFQNLAFFLSGGTGTYDNAHDTVVVDAVITTAVKLGSWYELRGDAGRRVYNLDAVGVVYNLDKSGAPDVLLVEGTDYEIDEQMGLVRILPAAVNITTGDTLEFSISTVATTPKDLDQVNALTTSEIKGTLLFIQDNAGDCGQKIEWRFHQANVSPDGDLPMIGDEVSVMAFSGIAEINSFITDPSQVLTVRTYDMT